MNFIADLTVIGAYSGVQEEGREAGALFINFELEAVAESDLLSV